MAATGSFVRDRRRCVWLLLFGPPGSKTTLCRGSGVGVRSSPGAGRLRSRPRARTLLTAMTPRRDRPIEAMRSRRRAARRTRSRSHPDRESSRGGHRLSRSRSVRARMRWAARRSMSASSPATANVIRPAPARTAFDSMNSHACSSTSHRISSPTRISGGRADNRVYQSMPASRLETGTPANRRVIALI